MHKSAYCRIDSFRVLRQSFCGEFKLSAKSGHQRHQNVCTELYCFYEMQRGVSNLFPPRFFKPFLHSFRLNFTSHACVGEMLMNF